jgi:hypothetical protein
MAVNKCKTISNSQMQNYQLVVIHNCQHIIHKTKLRWPCFISEIHTDVERRSWKILFDQ